MELNWKEISPARLSGKSNTTVMIEGELPDPEGRAVSAVLCCTANTQIEQASADNERVDITGSLTARITAQDLEGNIFVFDSEAGFEHSAEAPYAAPGMTAEIRAAVTSIETELKNGAIGFSAKLALSISVISCLPLRVLDGISGVDDLEFKFNNITCSSSTLIGARTLRMREELAESGVSEVLSCFGSASIRDTVCDGSGYSVGGVLTVNALTVDGNGRTAGIVRQLPFRELLDIEPSVNNAYCMAEVKSLNIHSLGEEFALLAMEAEICFKVYKTEGGELSLPADAFSPSFAFDCLNETAVLRNCYGAASSIVQLKEESILPDGAADIESCIFAAAEPIITGVESDKCNIYTSGILKTTVIYRSIGGSVNAYTDDIPFNIELGNMSCCNSPELKCICSVQAIGAERSVQLNFILQFEAELFDLVTVNTVVGLAEKERLPLGGGLIIAFASSGDTLFDIAKRYSVSSDCIKRINPDINEELQEGERLIILR